MSRLPEPVPVQIEALKRPLTPGEVLENFYANRSEKTLLAYRQDMVALASFMGVDVPGAVAALLHASQPEVNALAIRWLDSMAHLAPATRYRRLVTLRSFGRAARLAGHVTWVVEVKGPKVQRYRDTRGVTEDGVHKMFAACGEGLLGLRNRVILLLLGVLGLRRSEVAGLNTADLDVDGKRLHVLGKGDVEKWLHLPQAVSSAVNAWHTERVMMQMSKKIEHWTEDQNVPLVCSLANQNRGERLTGGGINFIVHEIASRAGVKAWAHALRHSTVTVALNRGHLIQDVQSLSRHSKLETVQIYDDNRQRRDASVSDDLAELYDKPPPGRPKLKMVELAAIFDFGHHYAEQSWNNLLLLDQFITAGRVKVEEYDLPEYDEANRSWLALFSASDGHRELCVRVAMWLDQQGIEFGGDVPYAGGRCDVASPGMFFECGWTKASKILAALDNSDQIVGVAPYRIRDKLFVFTRVCEREKLFESVTQVGEPEEYMHRPIDGSGMYLPLVK